MNIYAGTLYSTLAMAECDPSQYITGSFMFCTAFVGATMLFVSQCMTQEKVVRFITMPSHMSNPQVRLVKRLDRSERESMEEDKEEEVKQPGEEVVGQSKGSEGVIKNQPQVPETQVPQQPQQQPQQQQEPQKEPEQQPQQEESQPQPQQPEPQQRQHYLP